MSSRKLFIIMFSVLIIAGYFSYDALAGEKNPCGANPCAKNPCAMKNPCGKNPCAPKEEMKVEPIRKDKISDRGALLEKGKKLWNDTGLGTSGAACATCHLDGALLKPEPFPKYIKMANDIFTIDQMVNFCMINPMKGKIFPWNSTELTALAAYALEAAKGAGTKQPCGMKHPCEMKHPCGMKNPCGKK